jgi:hypothetical protein
LGSARTMAQLRNAFIKQMMSTATDAELIALGERFEKLLLEYVDAWLAWAPLMRAARAEAEADIATLTAAVAVRCGRRDDRPDREASPSSRNSKAP